MKNDYSLKPYTINTTGADMTLELLANKLDSGDIEVPDFQRGHVWNIAKASKLIESFLLGLPVPQIFLYQEPSDQKLLVVDGQQRLLAIQAFFKGLYKGKEFRLAGLDSQWNGKTFQELNEADKRRLKNVILRATIFRQVDPADNTSIFEVFERLNTGGMLLNAQEVRNAVIGGELNALTKELNQNEPWRELNNSKNTDARSKDVEMVLRLLALEDRYEEYKKPMSGFLNIFLAEHKVLSESESELFTKKFINTTRVINEKIGSNAFRLKKSVNTALADAIYVGVCRNLDNLNPNIRDSYFELLANSNFLDSVEQSTTDNDKVTNRITMAINAFAR